MSCIGIGLLNADAATVSIESSSFHGNSAALAPTAAGVVAAAAEQSGTSTATPPPQLPVYVMIAFSGSLALRSSRVTAHRGEVFGCNPLGACRFTVEDCVFSQLRAGALLHMCTGHSVALRRSTISGLRGAGILACPVARAAKPGLAGGGGGGGAVPTAQDGDPAFKRGAKRGVGRGGERWREDGRCGQFYPAPAADPGECNPMEQPCCSASGW